MPLKWTSGARADLVELVAYIAQDRPQAARRMAGKLRDAADELRVLPELGRVVPEFGDEAIRERIVRPYRLIYRLNGDTVEMLAVVHGRRSLGDVRDDDEA